MKKRINLFALLCALGLAFVLAGCGAKTKTPQTQAPAVTTTKAPVVTTKAPVVTTKAPVVTTKAPVTQPPQTTTVAPHEHVWDEGVITTDPTCTEKGVKTFTCSCGETRTEEVDVLGHNMTHHEAVDATCTEAGNVEYWSCDRCNKNFSDESGTTEVSDVTTAALSHDYAQVVSYDNIAQGKVETWNVCSRNAEHKELLSTKYTNEYNTLTHATGFNNNGSTNMAGTNFTIDPATKSVTVNKLPSTMGAWFRFDFARNSTTSYKYGYLIIKGNAEKVYASVKFDTLGQDGIANNKYNGTTGNIQHVNANSETTIVIWDFEALGMNSKELAKVVLWVYGTSEATDIKIEIIASGMFNLNEGTEKVVEHCYKDNNKDATCTEAGYTEKKCACGAVIDHVDLPALGHDLVDDAAVPATCTETGKTAGKHCSRCDYKEGGETVPAKGHTPVTDPAKAPTCTETGLTEGSHCSVCNAVLVAQETVPAKGHTEETIPEVPATYDAPGLTEGKKCSVCGTILVEQQAIPQLEYVITIDANGGTVTYNEQEIESLYVLKGAPASGLSALTVTPPEHYEFAKWQMKAGEDYVDIPEDATITADITIRPYYVQTEVIYKVVVQTEGYTRSVSTELFTFPVEKQYRNATGEFATMLGLTYNEAGDYYYAYGKKGTTPDFTALDNLPAIYGLVGSYPTDLIADETVTYTLKYNINEEALGYPLSKIHVGFNGDNTTYQIGLFYKEDNAGFMVQAPDGLKNWNSSMLSIEFDNLDISLYQTMSIQGSFVYMLKPANRMTIWNVNGDVYTDSSNSRQTVLLDTAGVPKAYNINLLNTLSNSGQSELRGVKVLTHAAVDGLFYLYIDKITITEKEDNRTITFKDGETVLSTKKVANNTVISAPATNPTKDGFYFAGWYNEELTQPFDFTQQINADVVVAAKWEAAVQYKVVIQTEHYTMSNSSAFIFPAEKQYRNATSEFATMLGLLYNEAEDYYYGMGRKGMAPDFTTLDELPAIYKLVGSYPENVIGDDTTYTIKFDINETALGYPLSKIKVGFDYDGTTYNIGLYKDAQHTGFEIIVVDGPQKNFAQPITILFDDLDPTLYSEIKVTYFGYYKNIQRNIKWAVNKQYYASAYTSTQSVGTNGYANIVDVLAMAIACGDSTLQELCFRPATNPDAGNELHIFIDKISVKEKTDNRTVTFKDGETVLSTKKVANNSVISAPADPTKDGFYFVGWYNEELTQPFDFTQQINADVVVAAKWDAAVQYKVTVKVAKYDFVKDSENKRVFNMGTVSYVDQTSQYAGLLGSDSNGILYGRTGDVASFTSLSALPSVYKLNTTLSQTTSTIANDGTTEYVLVYDIDEEALGVQLSQISLYDLINVDGYTFKTTPYITLNYESEELCGVKIYMKAGNKVEIRIAFDESINFNNYQSIMLNAKVKESTAEEKANSSEARPCTIIYTDKGNTEYYTYSGNPWGRYWGNFVNGVATIETNLIEEALHTQAKADATLTNVETLKYVSIVSIPWYGMNNGGAGVEVITYLGGVNITMKD